jgi:hypothetical protein
MNVYERFENYTEKHCWQYEIRQQNLSLDLKESGIGEEEAQQLSVSDFDFAFVPKENKELCQEIKDFIERHEWLGKMPIWATHRFTARLKRNGILAGVVVMATPNTFSNLLGSENKGKEKLIARGASISWSPKNMGSWLIMNAIRWMVTNTEFRFFTAYSDPEAKELGTIYQACNFIYLGQKFGTGNQFLDPTNPKRGWFGSSGFSDRSQIVRYAKKLGIEWLPEWYKMVGSKKNYRKVNWSTIPEETANRLKQERKSHKARCEQRPSPSKHKYVYILGRSKKETKFYKSLLEHHSPDKVGLSYPVLRGH